MGVGALVGVDVGGGGAGLLVGVDGLLKGPPVSLGTQRVVTGEGSRMSCPKDDTACYGDGDDSNENESCKNEEPYLRDATDSAPSVGSSLFRLQPCCVDRVCIVLDYFLFALFLIHRLKTW